MKQSDTHGYRKEPAQKEFSQLAKKYDKRWSFYIQVSLQETLKRLNIKPGYKIIDVGCGTGVLLETLAEKYPTVELAGIDPTPEMLSIARGRLQQSVQLKQAWAEELPFEDELFDIVISCNVFHYLRNPNIAIQEGQRILRPNGVFIVTDWCDDYLTCQICNWFLRVFNSAHYKTYSKQECYDLLISSGLKDIKIEQYKINWFWGMMTATACKKSI